MTSVAILNETLSRLRPDDQVALSAFAERPERLEDLTADRQSIADRIVPIQASGRTNTEASGQLKAL